MSKLKTFDSNFIKILLIFLVFILLVLFFPYWIRDKLFFYEFSDMGQIGDTLGGIMNPFIAIAAALLTFLAFWVQFKANEQQKRDLQIERFENKFYEMLKIHRDNITEITIGKSLRGRKSFISMFNELKFTYYSVKRYYETVYRPLNLQEDIDDDLIYNISYLIFFFGIGRNSSLIVLDIIGEEYEGFFNSVEEFISGQQVLWRQERGNGNPIDVEINDDINFTLDIRYVPCNGQMSKLSHYVRHLFQLVKFVDDADEKLFDYNSKYNYIASIRSQLSAHEQLLLFYNAVSALGKPWLENPNYLKKYCVIKSCPLPLANFYKDPKELLGDKNEHGKVMFEWGEIKNRLNS
ncbi:MAG: hypothetical protein O9267_11370 [Flavobacterium sp.]|uniref:putative phage abortive infection protein n=1 Tax=Flavobacterium sp. TaxID=239 RepID=UPI0022CCC6CB|nr:putative phage abortive infection protein [Flavobacterium sp.]MCZ8198195.1 hypothetical protein [Flavobacterium sp.]